MNRHTATNPPDSAPIPQDGRIDPAKAVIAAKPKRRRKLRNRPEPAPELRKWEAAAEARMFKRPFPPNAMLEPAGFDEEHWTSPHSDTDLWVLQLADAFGTRSQAVLAMFMGQLEELCGKSHWDDEAKQWRLDENQFSAALAIVNSLHPRNELEAAHAAQMVAVHLLTMKVAARAIKYEYDTRTASVAGKLARTFTAQREAFERIRKPNRTARQSIKVTKELHQHVHYHRGDDGNEGQPHGPPTTVVDQCATLPSPEQGGEVVPLPSRPRKARLPGARRG